MQSSLMQLKQDFNRAVDKVNLFGRQGWEPSVDQEGHKRG